MNYYIDTHTQKKSSFVEEEYFPAIIDFDGEELNNSFIEFKYNDSDMFELSVDKDSHILKRFCLTLCNHCSFEEVSLHVPNCDEGVLYFYEPNTIECETFSLTVYTNGIKLQTSIKSLSSHIKCGQVIFAFTDSEELGAILITELTKDEILHVKNELLN